MVFQQYPFGPKKIPKIIKTFLILITLFSILASINPRIFYFLGLSFHGIEKGFFWQIITNLFIIPNQNISFSFVFHLGFNLYLMWVLGTEIISLKGEKQFLIFLSITSLITSVITIFFLSTFSKMAIFAGANIFLYCLSICFLQIHKEGKIFLFYSIAVKTKWIVLAIIIINILSNLSNENWTYVLSYIVAFVFSYFYTLLVWGLKSSFKCLFSFEKKILHIMQKIKGKRFLENDEDFMEKMFRKISLYGKKSLTKREKKRMDKISKKK